MINGILDTSPDSQEGQIFPEGVLPTPLAGEELHPLVAIADSCGLKTDGERLYFAALLLQHTLEERMKMQESKRQDRPFQFSPSYLE